MKLNVHLNESHDRLTWADRQDREGLAMDRENIFELGHRARQETERFINGHIHDSTQGWPIRARLPWVGLT